AHSSKETLYFANRGGRHSSLSNQNGKPVEANSLDNVLQGKPITFINMDIEGAEKEAIIGCSQIIHKYRPKMLIAAYHRTEDIFELPLQISEIAGEYSFYFRHYQYIPAWDVNLYCIPKK
ncbi:MAG: FkbM family methyltransferase, partial [Oscillospiraceae bacterium]